MIEADTVQHEVGVGLAVGYQGGQTVVAGGLGGDLAYHLWWDHLVAHVKVGPRLYLAPALEIDAGAGWAFDLGRGFSVTAGLEVAAMAGGVVRRISEVDADPVGRPPVAARVFVRPIELRTHGFQIRALGLAGGVGLDAPGRSLAIGVDLFEIGLLL